MGANSKIEWTHHTGRALGSLKTAAKRCGLSLQQYIDRREQGLKRCIICRLWKAECLFPKDASRGDGLAAKCSDCASKKRRETYTPKPHRDLRGRRYAAPRDGDKEQARGRVNHLVNVGLIPDPNERPCSRCGHQGSDRRHEYHHHLGYAAEHHETVIPVCSTCHAAEHPTERERDEYGRYKN